MSLYPTPAQPLPPSLDVTFQESWSLEYHLRRVLAALRELRLTSPAMVMSKRVTEMAIEDRIEATRAERAGVSHHGD